MKVAVTGATGFVGGRLATELADRGHEVAALTRSPGGYEGAGTAVEADVADESTLGPALAGAQVAVYLVHSLDRDDFEAEDARRATTFGKAAAAAGVERIVYLGGLGAEDPDELSAHLRSRREVESLLRDGGVPVTVLRAAVVIGDGGISWEITRQLSAKLPAMVTPKWVDTLTQPIAIEDAVAYLAAAVENEGMAGTTYEIGGPDTLTYRDMLETGARIIHNRRLRIVVVPVLTPKLSSMWISLVTDVDTTTARNLIDSLGQEVVVHDHSIRSIVARDLVGYDESVHRALTHRRERVAPTIA